MAYATAQDILAQYGERELLMLADRDGDGVADTGVVEAALADAAEEIDGYLAGEYDLPLDPTRARPLRRIAVDIAVYRLATDTLATDERRARYQDAVRYLERVSRGEIRLGAGDDRPVRPQRVQVRSAPRRFSRRSMGLG